MGRPDTLTYWYTFSPPLHIITQSTHSSYYILAPSTPSIIGGGATSYALVVLEPFTTAPLFWGNITWN